MAKLTPQSSGVWGPNSNNPILNQPDSVKPHADKLIWFGSQHEDLFYGRPYTYSFTDVHASVILPFVPAPGISSATNLPGLTLLSISEHRDKYPVVSLGSRGIKGYTMGNRTTAGTLAFTVFGEMPFAEVIRKYAIWNGKTTAFDRISPDELPPVDIVLSFISEEGHTANVVLRGVTFLDRSQNVSVRDIQLTEVYSFMAAGCTYFIKELPLTKIEPEKVPVSQKRDPWTMARFATSTTPLTTSPTTTATTTPFTRTTTSTTTTTTSTTTTSTTTTSTTTTTTTTPTTTTATTTTATTVTTTSTTSSTATPGGGGGD